MLLSVKAGVVDNGLGVVVMAAFGFVSLTLPLSQDICDLLILREQGNMTTFERISFRD